MGRVAGLWHSTVGKKLVMGGTGLIMIAFLLAHMAGNLQVFLGAARLNAYSRLLHSLGELLWVVRGGLGLALALHILAAVQLTRADWAARPVDYAKYVRASSTLASRTIRWGGLLLALFIAFHLMHFTTGTIRPAPFSATDVYGNVTRSFAVPWVAALYVLAMGVVGLHLYHGAWSAFRSLGVARPSRDPLRRRGATVLAAVLWLGFTVVPVSVLLGWVR